MNMQEHILAALRACLDEWLALLGSLEEARITAPLRAGEWSPQDIVAHLMVWQQRTNAYVEAALRERPPVFPRCPVEIDSEEESDPEPVNAWVFETHHRRPWPDVLADWHSGFETLLARASQIPEPALLDWGRYPWLDGVPLALILIASYDHHAEHLRELRAALAENRKNRPGS